MGDLYSRLKEIRRTREAGIGNSPRGPSRDRTGTAVSPGREWKQWSDGVFIREVSGRLNVTGVSTDEGAGARQGAGPFSPDLRWDSLSPVTGRPAGLTPVFLDIETTGLSGGAGNFAFLVGTGVPSGRDTLTIRQYFLAEPAVESEYLGVILHDLKALPDRMYVTYNGGSFDLPVLRSRCIMNRITFPEDLHWDVLHLVRRLYATRIENCSLGTVEASVLGRPRLDDVSGKEAPERYQAYLSSRDVRTVQPVIEHHRRDILHLAEVAATVNAFLSGTLPSDGDSRVGSRPLPPDRLELARLLLGAPDGHMRRRGWDILQNLHAETAARAVRTARHKGVLRRGPGKRWIRVREIMAEEIRRQDDPEGYRRIRQELFDGARRRSDLIALVKILEHRDRNYPGAIVRIEEWCRSGSWDDELRHRYLRLKRREARRTAQCTVPPNYQD